MKIFGWMHQKLCLGTAEYHRVAHRNSPDVLIVDDGSGNNGTLLATHGKERETEALLLHHVLLTIGTLGHSTPQPDQEKQRQQQILEEEEEDRPKHEEEEEADSAVVIKPTASTPHSPTLEISKLPEYDEKKPKQEVIIIEEVVISREPLLKEDNEKNIEKRTTLADLFAADQEATSTDNSAGNKHATCPTKNVLKKIKNTQSPPASKKIHRLITRMLKKKIHPDLARGDLERHARRGAADGAGEGLSGDFRLPRGS